MDITELRCAIDERRLVDEALLRHGQPEGWNCDQRTRDIWCLTRFISDRFVEFRELGHEERRRDLLLMFNQIVRSVVDPFEAASVVVKVGDEGLKISDYTKDYWTARRQRS